MISQGVTEKTRLTFEIGDGVVGGEEHSKVGVEVGVDKDREIIRWSRTGVHLRH